MHPLRFSASILVEMPVRTAPEVVKPWRPNPPLPMMVVHKVESFRLPENLWYHRIQTTPSHPNDRFSDIHHAVSFSSHPLDRGAVVYSAVSHFGSTPNPKSYGYEFSSQEQPDIVNRPFEVESKTVTDHPWRNLGIGTIARGFRAKLAGVLVGDMSVADESQSVWKGLMRRMSGDPNFRGGLSSWAEQLGDQKVRHWAEWTGPRPVPHRSYTAEGHPLEHMVGPYKTQQAHLVDLVGRPTEQDNQETARNRAHWIKRRRDKMGETEIDPEPTSPTTLLGYVSDTDSASPDYGSLHDHGPQGFRVRWASGREDTMTRGRLAQFNFHNKEGEAQFEVEEAKRKRLDADWEANN